MRHLLWLFEICCLAISHFILKICTIKYLYKIKFICISLIVLGKKYVEKHFSECNRSRNLCSELMHSLCQCLDFTQCL